MRALRALGILALAGVVGGCATAAALPPDAGVPAAAIAPAPYSGPKKRIAVAKFDAHGAFVGVYGSWDVGGGLSAQLVTELVRTGRFVVLEREDLAPVLREQEMAMASVVDKDTAARVGRVLGAQLLVRGAVTEFDERKEGGGMGLGLSLPYVAPALALHSATGAVAIDLRLVDTTTGEVVQSQRAEAKIRGQALAAGVAFPYGTWSGEAFQKTALGGATREAIARAVAVVVSQMDRIPWTAQVADVSGSAIYVNAGAQANMRPGMVLAVSAIDREIKDPATGASLGVVERPVGDVVIDAVQEKFSVARPLTPMAPQRGDLVRIK